jgi:putative DNA primase/helicase
LDYKSILDRFKVKEQNGNRAKAICPAHPDREASLSLRYDATENKTLVYCHAGCESGEILDRVGLKMADLFDKSLEKSSKYQTQNIEKIYQYKDQTGKVLFEKIRYKPKRFNQRRVVNGITLWGLEAGRYYETFKGSGQYSMKERNSVDSMLCEGVEPVLYNLPDLIQVIEGKEEVYIVEGEKDVENLKLWGLTGTCNFDGASMNKQKSKWRPEYNQYFKGARVVIIPDNDEPGRAHAQCVAANLAEIADYVKVINLPELDY